VCSAIESRLQAHQTPSAFHRYERQTSSRHRDARQQSRLVAPEQRSVDGKWRSRFDRLMKTKTTGLILALCFFGTALCFADDPQMGASKLDESKSKLTPGTGKIKPTYISLVQFTDKGIQNAKQTTQRVAAWAAKVQSMGVTIKQMYWTLGQYDQVCIFEAPDDETAASVLLAADMLGNIRTQTMRAFTASEMEKILANVP
jgi:uncharacterized protein with GYD domain